MDGKLPANFCGVGTSAELNVCSRPTNKTQMANVLEKIKVATGLKEENEAQSLLRQADDAITLSWKHVSVQRAFASVAMQL